MEQFDIKRIEYKNGSVFYRIFDNTINTEQEKTYEKGELSEQEKQEREQYKEQFGFLSDKSKYVSIHRTKDKIYQIANCNTWSYFATLTFKDEEIRTDIKKCKKQLRYFLNKYAAKRIEKSGRSDFKYLFVPERHEKGGFHFHGLITEVSEDELIEKKDGYMWKAWKYGISDLSEVRDMERISTYITKYITKDIETQIDQIGTSRYIASRNCNTPKTQYYRLKDDFSLHDENIKDFTSMLVRDNLDCLEYSKKIGAVTYIKFKKKEQINLKKVVDEIKK